MWNTITFCPKSIAIRCVSNLQFRPTIILDFRFEGRGKCPHSLVRVGLFVKEISPVFLCRREGRERVGCSVFFCRKNAPMHVKMYRRSLRYGCIHVQIGRFCFCCHISGYCSYIACVKCCFRVKLDSVTSNC